ncbi:MAG: RING finger domain-containing protein [Candidatus Hodarchaeota archaeon]
MRTGNEEFQLTLEAEKLLANYIGEVWKALIDGQSSPTEAREITEELNEHILQAYWKETGLRLVEADPLLEILKTMGDSREVASEYLIDRKDAHPIAPRDKGTHTSISSRIGRLKSSLPKYSVLLYLILPLIVVIGIYLSLLSFFPRLKDLWFVLLAIADIILLIPLLWYQIRWKASQDLGKWWVMKPHRMRYYLIIASILVVLGGVILPFLRGSGDYRYNENYEALPNYEESLPWGNSLTLDGSIDRYYFQGDSWGSYHATYWIDSSFIILANLVQLFLVILFLVAAVRVPIHWKQFGVRVDLLDVSLPEQVYDTGLISIRTINYNPIDIPLVQMKILGQSPNIQTTIEPSVRTTFGSKDSATWFIQFNPQTAGTLKFGSIVVQISDNLTISSHLYHLRVEEGVNISNDSRISFKPDISSDFPLTLDLLGDCGICRQSFQASDLASFCLHCGSVFHSSHIREWLKSHETCPSCTKPIQISREDRNYSELVLQHLKQLEDECRRLKTRLESFENSPKETIDISTNDLNGRRPKIE